MSKVIKKRSTLPRLQLGTLIILLAVLIGFGAQEGFADSATFHDDTNMLNSSVTSNSQIQANGLPSKVASLTSTSSNSAVSASHFRRSTTTRSYSSSRSSNSGFQIWGCLIMVVIAVISLGSHVAGRIRTLKNNQNKGIGSSNGYEIGEPVGENKHSNYSNGFTAGGSDWNTNNSSSVSFTTSDSGWNSNDNSSASDWSNSGWGNNDNSSSGFTTGGSDWNSSSNSSSSDWGSSGGSFDSGSSGNSSNW